MVVDNGVVFQFVEHLFDSWDSDNLWWDHYWWDNYRRNSLSYLLLEILINFTTVHSPQTLFRIFGIFPSAHKIFSGYFGIFPSAQISFQDIWNLSVRPTSFQDILESFRPPKYLFRIFLESFRPPIKSFQDIFGIFPSAPKSFQDILGQFQTSFPG